MPTDDDSTDMDDCGEALLALGAELLGLVPPALQSSCAIMAVHSVDFASEVCRSHGRVVWCGGVVWGGICCGV